ncbi:hypothetical protein GCM10009557_82960 [Virgisporangium ochraceum]|uniref:Uncharacterized protein n=1 Tax=Virgisporangium ochraceum TaxID=65505 RepID=A0A8J4A2M7_9ACTN|nr:hypothetical protein [Virgisporangium ochraceum]GIJ73447.1 hypothetical protein Voc01_083640 [Virgisporangium ochraceum]
MADFARGMQWLFTIVGLLFVGGAGADVLFDSGGFGTHSITMSCSSNGTLMNCSGQVGSLDDEVRLQTVATVGVGLLLVAAIMAVTAGAAVRRVPQYPQYPPYAGPPPAGTPYPEQHFPVPAPFPGQPPTGTAGPPGSG